MLSTLRQARTAFSHLNPNGIRRIAARPLRVGLIAARDSGYVAMEEALIPPRASVEERAAARELIFRGDDPNAPSAVDLVLYEQTVRAPQGAYSLYCDDLPSTMADILVDHTDYELPLARQFPGFRRVVTERIMHGIARENALFAVATALPDVIPNLMELPWTFGEWASDTAFLTANQVRMAFLISAACGKDIGFGAQKGQLATIGLSAFGWRAIARELASKIPFGGGLVAKGAIAYAGTVAVGKALEFLHREDMELPRHMRRQAYKEALDKGREFTQNWLKKLPGRRPAA